MKKFIVLAIALCMAASTFAQIPNNSFENWTNTNGYNMPDGWDNLNSMTTSQSVYTCTKGTPGSVGAAYLKLISQTVTGMGVMPGVAVSGTIDMNSMMPAAGFACADRPTSLKGKWQYMASGNDQGFIAIYLTKWNSGMGMRDTIGMAMQMLNGMAMSWANFTIPISYNNPANPDSAIIILSASGDTPVNGSYLYIDNLSFTIPTTGLTTEEVGLLKLYPNPASSVMQLDLTGLTVPVKSITITNIEGKVVSYVTNATTKINTIDVSTLPAGLYILQVQTEKGNISKKFTVK